ncbi:MAG: SCO family protein [Ilumatobacteraceae bacterium]
MAATVVAVIAVATVSCGNDAATASLRGAVRTPALQVGSITLPDAANAGAPTPMRAPAGQLYLVYFGYTSCPDVCPTTLSDIRVALDDLPAALASRVTVAMATVDPERDTDEVLTGYLAHFFDHSIALRQTDPSALAAAAGTFGVKWEVEAHEAGAAYDVSHTAVTYVVDDTGTVVVEWPFGFDTADMTSDITTLLEEETT